MSDDPDKAVDFMAHIQREAKLLGLTANEAATASLLFGATAFQRGGTSRALLLAMVGDLYDAAKEHAP